MKKLDLAEPVAALDAERVCVGDDYGRLCFS